MAVSFFIRVVLVDMALRLSLVGGGGFSAGFGDTRASRELRRCIV